MVSLIDIAKSEFKRPGTADWFKKLTASQQAEVWAAIDLVTTGELTNAALARAIIKQYGLSKTPNHITMTLRNLANERTGKDGKGGTAARVNGKTAAKANR